MQGGSTGARESRPKSPRGGPLGRIAIALTLTWALGVSLALWPPGFGEPWVLRWARALVEHPTRTALALGLTLWALRTPDRGPGPGNGAGQGFGEVL